MRVSPSFVAGACNGAAWAHILVGIWVAGNPGTLWLGVGIFLMCGGWRAAQYRWEARSRTSKGTR